MPKVGAWTRVDASIRVEARGSRRAGARRWRCAAASSAPSQPLGPAPYLLGGTPLEERVIGGSQRQGRRRWPALLADAARFGFSATRKCAASRPSPTSSCSTRVYDAPRDERGRRAARHVDRRAPVDARRRRRRCALRWGCDGRTLRRLASPIASARSTAPPSPRTSGALLDARSPRLAPSARREPHAAAPGSAWCSPTAPPISSRCTSRPAASPRSTARAARRRLQPRPPSPAASALHIFDIARSLARPVRGTICDAGVSMHASQGVHAAAALVSRHGPTCRRVAQSLGAAGVHVRTLAVSQRAAASTTSATWWRCWSTSTSRPASRPACSSPRRASRYPDAPLMATAGVDARARLLDALVRSRRQPRHPQARRARRCRAAACRCSARSKAPTSTISSPPCAACSTAPSRRA